MSRAFKSLMLGTAFFSAMVVILLFFAPPAKAVTLVPPSLEINLKPGSPIKSVIKLFNETDKIIQLYPETSSFTAKGETGQPDFDVKPEADGLISWIEMEKGPIVLSPGDRYQVPITLKPPADADPGGHYAVIFFSTAPPEAGQVRIAAKVGTLILAKVDGEIREKGTIAEFAAKDGKKVFDRLPIEFFARFQNTGNVHLKPSGQVTITNIFGKVSGIVEFNAGQGATLPQTIRKYNVVWEGRAVVEKPGNFWSEFWQGYGNEKNNFGLGRYTARLSLKAGNLDKAEITANDARISFWILPWRVILVWFVIVAVGALALIVLIRKYNAWIIKKSKP